MQGFDLVRVERRSSIHAAHRPDAPAWLLAEGESRWPGAVTFRWPDSDAYRKLTRDHYRVVSLSPIPLRPPLPERARRLRAGSRACSTPRWRWLERRRRRSAIFPRRTIRAVVVRLALDRSAPLPANTVTVSIDGAAGRTVEIARGALARTSSCPSAADQPVEIAFRSARSFVPPAAASRRAGSPCSSLPSSGSPAKLRRSHHTRMPYRPSVSLVIPMFNEEESIGHALACATDALERHCGDWEIVVVDDASTDRSAAIVDAGVGGRAAHPPAAPRR